MLPKPEYSRKLNRSTLTLTITKEDYESEIDRIEMFHYNKIPYFLHMDTQKENISLRCSYDITGRHSLDSLLKYKTLNSQLLRNILNSFDQACIHAEKYLLTENDILLKPEFIFSKSDYSQFVFCYLPGSQNKIHRQFQSLMEDLLQKIDHKDVQAVKIAYGVHQKVAIDQCPLHTVLENLESYCTDQILHASSLEYAKSLPYEQSLEQSHSLVQEEPSPYAKFPKYTDPAQYNQPLDQIKSPSQIKPLQSAKYATCSDTQTCIQPPQTADVHQSKVQALCSDTHTCIHTSQITDPSQSQNHTAGFDTQTCIQPPQTADVHQSKIHPPCSNLQPCTHSHSTQVGDAHQSKIHPPCSNTQTCIQPPQITDAPLSTPKTTCDHQYAQPAHHPGSKQPEQTSCITHQQSYQPSQCDQSLQHNPLLQYAESPLYTKPPQHSEPLQHSELFQHTEPPQHSESLQHSEPSPNSLADSNETPSQKFPKQLTRKKNKYPEKEKASLKHQAVEKLKNIFHNKLYTNRSKLPDEAPVFEADEEEITSSNPTVCLMPDSDIIQNIFIYQGADRTRDFSCSSQKSVLGSSIKDSNIYIPLPKISRVHAIVEIDEQGTFLEDMNSTNGTYINDELLPYHERRMLQKGDIISLAGECYSFH